MNYIKQQNYDSINSVDGKQAAVPLFAIITCVCVSG